MKCDGHSREHPPKSACRHPQEVFRPSLQDQPKTEKALLTKLLDDMGQAEAKAEQAEAQGALKFLVGPSTPWAPALFDLGADVLAGSIITKPAAVLKAVARDLPFYQIEKQGVRLANWVRPGLDLKL